MNGYINLGTWIASTLFGCLMLASPAQAASFDCAKARSKVEHIICDTPEISRLDDLLDTAYKDIVRGEQHTADIKQGQKQWMKERNGCADEMCVKRAYEMRLVELTSSDSQTRKHGSVQSASHTDDYVLDPEPKEMVTWNWEEYREPEDKEVCSLYLQNLQYFARRGEPLSCGQPIAPMLQDKIKRAEWENLDPEKHPTLAAEIIKSVEFKQTIPSEKVAVNSIQSLMEHNGFVFRLLIFTLKGSPGVEEGSNQPLPEQELSVVQFGNDVTRSDNQNYVWRCHLSRSRVMDSVRNLELHMFVVSKDLKQIYYKLGDWRGNTGQNLWFINNRMYGEYYDEKADVKLTELRNADFGKRLVLEPVCLFHFKQASN